MQIQRNETAVPSVMRSDADAQPFKSPEKEFSDAKKQGEQTKSPHEDTLSLGLYTYGNRSDASSHLENAISFAQTQEGFLRKSEETLERMREIAWSATVELESPAEQEIGSFAQLQENFKEFSERQFQDFPLFGPDGLEVMIDSNLTLKLRAVDLGAISLRCGLAQLSSPADSPRASDQALRVIEKLENSLATLAEFRIQVREEIDRLQRALEKLNAELNGPPASAPIQSVLGAEESALRARYNILGASNQAMLAQANLLPESALRLLDSP